MSEQENKESHDQSQLQSSQGQNNEQNDRGLQLNSLKMIAEGFRIDKITMKNAGNG